MATQLENSMQMTTAKIAHEMKNPLAIIRANIQLLELEDKDNEHKRNYNVMYAEIDRINRLILEFIEVSKPKEYQFKKIEIKAIFHEILQDIDAELKFKAIVLICNISNEDMFVWADRAKIKEVFVNMIKNASEAVEKGGKIYITIFKSDNYINVKIEDNGKGIPEEYIDYIGKPFFTTKKGGSGLGVSISKKIIEDHEGTFSIASVEGEGSSISILLPQYEQKNQSFS